MKITNVLQERDRYEKALLKQLLKELKKATQTKESKE